jgi:4-amino-4-deoxy-L-arabinose transferase-like glycosyltransferase
MVFAVAVGARFGWGVWRHAGQGNADRLEFPDEQQYWQMSRSLRAGDGLRDELGFQATRMPLYPGFLSLFPDSPQGMFLVRSVQAVLGAAAAIFAAGLAGAMFGTRAAWIAGLLVAGDPFLVFFSGLLLTETIFVAGLLGLWWILVPRWCGTSGSWFRWVAAGAAAALCVYTRESAAGLVTLAVLGAGLVRGREARNLLGAGLAVGIILASLSPWALRNRCVLGEWRWLTTRGGISLYDGVGPQATGESNLGGIKAGAQVRGLNELEWDRYFRREAWQAIVSDPARASRLAAVKIGRMWNPLPNVSEYQSPLVRTVSAGWMLPLLFLALAGSVGLGIQSPGGFWRLLLLLLPALYLTGLHSLFIGSVRYRLAAMPMLEILAAYALIGTARRGVGRTGGAPNAA